MKNNQHEPIFFTPPSGDTKRPRRLHKGGGGGDGGAAKRKKEEDARVASAIKKINAIFAIDQFEPEAVNQAAFMQELPDDTSRYGAFNIPSRNAKPIEVPDGYELQTQAVKASPIGMNLSSINGIGNVGSQTKRYLFNRKGYDEAVAASKAAAAKKNQDALASREGLYTQIGEDATNKALVDLNKDRDVAEREFKFMLARAGLSGGSRDIDVNRDLLDTHQQGILKASELGLSASNNARSADDKTRVNLINSIRAGLDEGSAMQQAYEGMRNNARTAQDEANATTLAGFFDVLRQQQQQAAYSQAANDTIQQYKKTPYSSAVSGDRGRTGSY